MCQLLGVSARAPVRMSLSWDEFALRGSEQGGNPDGWGVAYADATDVRLVREPCPAVDSELVAFLGRHGPAATTVVSHVRRATAGERTLSNTQPFVRALGGRTHVFAHNGHIAGLQAPRSPWLQPVGGTDSEVLFALLLEQLAPLWSETDAPVLDARTDVIARFAEDMRGRGAANFLYYDGLTLFAHAHRRTLPGADISDDPGLHVLVCPIEGDDDPCEGLGCLGADTTRTVVATLPLGSRGWRALDAGELLRVQAGRLV